MVAGGHVVTPPVGLMRSDWSEQSGRWSTLKMQNLGAYTEALPVLGIEPTTFPPL